MRIIISIILLFFAVALHAEDGQELWLRKGKALPVKVICSRSSATLDIAKNELKQNWSGKANASILLEIINDKTIKQDGFKLAFNAVRANTELGILYGVYELLRQQRINKTIKQELNNPSYSLRMLNHWDNLDGSVERGYAGKSIFWRKDNPFEVNEEDKKRWTEYARANASIGINGTVLNNVNSSPLILTADYMKRTKAIADVLRPYGIKVFLSVKFSSPSLIGGLETADPLNADVANWWKDKMKEVYGLIPDFGGLLIKANSEGQPGPQDYKRTHADGANMMADALKPYGGIVMWRAFVYSPNDKDRAKQAYNEFMPLDGKFRDNVIVQVKNGPIDFQPREPISPLFGAMKKTPVMPEFQITQEYLGHSTHLVFLAPMWNECLQTDTYHKGASSTVAKCTDGSIYQHKLTAIAGVANIGLDTNWCGHDFAQANWYAFGRMAWNSALSSQQIANEWLWLTFYGAPSSRRNDGDYMLGWYSNFLVPVKKMMLDSREAAVNYMMPLGLHHIFAAEHHYGPGPWWAPAGTRVDWTPPYYHQADANGIGFNRTRTGSNAVGQYHEPYASILNDAKRCPENLLLWFHHLPWDFKMKSGNGLWYEICSHYDQGVKQVKGFQQTWNNALAFVDAQRFEKVQTKLTEQYTNAVVWRDACLLYFQQLNKLPFPEHIDKPVHQLTDLINNDNKSR